MGAEGSVTLQLREAVEAPDSGSQIDTTALTIGYSESDIIADMLGSIQAAGNEMVMHGIWPSFNVEQQQEQQQKNVFNKSSSLVHRALRKRKANISYLYEKQTAGTRQTVKSSKIISPCQWFIALVDVDVV